LWQNKSSFQCARESVARYEFMNFLIYCERSSNTNESEYFPPVRNGNNSNFLLRHSSAEITNAINFQFQLILISYSQLINYVCLMAGISFQTETIKESRSEYNILCYINLIQHFLYYYIRANKQGENCTAYSEMWIHWNHIPF
jgi:hypothetical protein